MGSSVSKGEIAKEYEFLGKVGSGTFASVYKAKRYSDGRVFAVKIIKKTKLNRHELELAKSEVAVMRALNHKNVVRLYDVFEDKRKVYMVLEYLAGGSLLDAIQQHRKHMSEHRIASICRDIASGLAYCHQIGVVHRDLKPDNLLLTSQDNTATVKITDFGLARFVRSPGEYLHTICGSPSYVAPEVLTSDAEYTQMVDMWSFGVVLYMLLTGDRPFPNAPPRQLFKLIREGDYRTDQAVWSEISAPARDLVRRLLVVNPNKRLTATDVLQHPWLYHDVAPRRSLGDGHYRRIMHIRAVDKLRRVVNLLVVANRIKRLLAKIQYEWTSVYEAPTVLTREEIELMRQEKNVLPQLRELDRIRSESAGSKAQAEELHARRHRSETDSQGRHHRHNSSILRLERRAKMMELRRSKDDLSLLPPPSGVVPTISGSRTPTPQHQQQHHHHHHHAARRRRQHTVDLPHADAVQLLRRLRDRQLQ